MIRRSVSAVLAVGVLAFAVCVPFISAGTHGIFSGPLDEPGTLQILALCLAFGGVAMTYDLLFGYTGLLSFGHALYFAVGVYAVAIATTKWDWSFPKALAFTAAVGLVLPLVLGAICLRVSGIAFAMVTLAFAQAGAILVEKNPHRWTGAEEGVITDYTKLPSAFVGVLNTKNLYWLALGYAVVVFALIAWACASSPGHIWQAIRENELRVQVLGLRPFSYKLGAFVVSAFLATAGGVVYVLIIGSATPEVTSANFTLTLLVMVVLGGSGTRWGALIGGVVYTFADQRLPALAASDAVQNLPGFLKTPLSEPLFVLGVLFILIVFFLPGGIAGLATRARRPRLSRSTVGPQPEPEAGT
ncbi:MAG TPA: branched-chain amino acid ABC transporter permease [Gaiellaceae bacterium]|jgi:branched-chain amino acid transport system permease protein|nr:branched-chain amino acid ABC transporter permease [Gaiellaceae bacterium]